MKLMVFCAGIRDAELGEHLLTPDVKVDTPLDKNNLTQHLKPNSLLQKISILKAMFI